MSGYKEFEGKTLDDAIRDACAFYDTTRDKLEIDILNDAKGGIFGLVGVKKARLRARLVELTGVLEGLDSLASKGKQQKKRNEPPVGGAQKNAKRETRDDTPRREREMRPAPAKASTPAPVSSHEEHVAAPAANAAPASSSSPLPEDAAREKRASRPPRAQRKERPRNENRKGRPEHGEARSEVAKPAPLPVDADLHDLDADGEELSRVPFDQLDVVELENTTREVVSRLTEPFLGPVAVGVTIGNDRVRISLADVEDPGLLIGRDGQTLASLQYLVTRMLSNRMKALLRVQIDAGDYRERQDERLREMALSLAEKVKASGRPQVTRPLSSYHRRVIHLTLQDDPQIQTHSKGEGEMKRVMVTRKKGSA